MRAFVFGILMMTPFGALADVAAKVDCNKVAYIHHANKKTKLRIEDYNERESHGLITSHDERFKALKSLAVPLNAQMERLSLLLNNDTYIGQIEQAKSLLKEKSGDERAGKLLATIVVTHSENFRTLLAETRCKTDQLKMCQFDKDTRDMVSKGSVPIINFHDLKRLRSEKKVMLLPCTTGGILESELPN